MYCNERKPSFLEKLVVSTATGAVCGAICGGGEVDEETRQNFTGQLIGIALNVQERLKQQDKNGYFRIDGTLNN